MILITLLHVARLFGDPHIVTLDGHKYTFNGKGEFVLIETLENRFTLQGRMLEASNPDGVSVPASVFTAVVAKQDDSDTVQLEFSKDGVEALVNGEEVDFSDIPEQEFTNVTLKDVGNDTVTATFSSGVYIQVKEQNGFLSSVVVSVPRYFKFTTKGLMGFYNGDSSDDLLPRFSDDRSSLQAN